MQTTRSTSSRGSAIAERPGLIMSSAHRGPSVGVLMLVVVATLGCAHQPPVPSGLLLGPRTDLGTIAVIAQATPNPGRLAGPVTRGEAATGRALEYTMKSLVVGAHDRSGVLLTLAIFVSPVTATAGAIVGATQGVSASDVDAARAPVERALRQADLGRLLRDRVVARGAERAREMLVAAPIVDRRPDSAAVPPPHEARTLLELRLHEVRLARFTRFTPDPNPSLTFTVKARLRIVTIADGKEIFARDLESDAETRAFSEWIADDARHFRAALAGAIESLAARVVDEVL
jgi:hypothetical protein